jgi:ferredoxin
MILDRRFYQKASRMSFLWWKWKIFKISGRKIYKSFQLVRLDEKNKLYFYSPRLRKIPRYIGTKDLLSAWSHSKDLENECPTKAIKVLTDKVEINLFGCISCGQCVDFAPPGILENIYESDTDVRI